ncbi:MAG: YdjY domain-containing protein [Desulfohalobiaceae bacterium]|nr:YdjY domain-containing protein [Desulfohalobiaceae bacterium]
MKLMTKAFFFTFFIPVLLAPQVVLAQASKRVTGTTDWMDVDAQNKTITFSATVTKDASKPAVISWGRRGQAWIGCRGGSMEAYFIFTTDVPRPEINKAIQDIGVRYTNQIKKNWRQHKGLKETTSVDDFLNGDPVLVSIQFQKNGKKVQRPLEYFIQEKIEVKDHDARRPYTPHFVYHGTGEAIDSGTGCIVCPSDCYGGIITDNRLPVRTYDSWYRVDWERMPKVGSKVVVILNFS